MDKTFIENLRIRCIIGVNEWERTTVQEIQVSVEVLSDTRKAALSDNIADCIDYAQLSQKIRDLAIGARRFTVEALAEDIAKLCLATPGVRKVSVRVEKPGAVSDADTIGVQIERPG
jgi:FolB domain-containing protein